MILKLNIRNINGPSFEKKQKCVEIVVPASTNIIPFMKGSCPFSS